MNLASTCVLGKYSRVSRRSIRLTVKSAILCVSQNWCMNPHCEKAIRIYPINKLKEQKKKNQSLVYTL